MLFEPNQIHANRQSQLDRTSIIARPVMLAVKAKIYGVLYKQSSSIAFDETSSYSSALESS